MYFLHSTEQAESNKKLVEAKNKQIVYGQIWDLFPAFCDLPVDLTQVNIPLAQHALKLHNIHTA